MIRKLNEMAIPMGGNNYRRQRMYDLLVTAFEGGVNYWVNRAYVVKKPTHIKFDPDGDLGEFMGGTYEALMNDGAVKVQYENTEEDGGKQMSKVITYRDLSKGLEIMKEKYPRNYKDFMDENEDAGTADVWFQCALLGETIFG